MLYVTSSKPSWSWEEGQAGPGAWILSLGKILGCGNLHMEFMKTSRVQSLLNISGNSIFKATQACPANAMLIYYPIHQETLWPESWPGSELAKDLHFFSECITVIPVCDVDMSRAQQETNVIDAEWSSSSRGPVLCASNGFTMEYGLVGEDRN